MYHVSVFSFFFFKDRNSPIMQQLSNVGMNNTNMGRSGGNMNPMAVLQLFQSLQGLSTLAQLTSNLGALSGNSGGLAPGGGISGSGAAAGMPDTSGTNPLAALGGLGMLGSTLGLGGGGGGGSSGIGGLGSSHHNDGGTSGRQVFVRNVSSICRSLYISAISYNYCDTMSSAFEEICS